MERFLTSVISTMSATMNVLSFNPREVSFKQYMSQLKDAPGSSVAEKVNYLTSMGINLNAAGMRELQHRNRTMNDILPYLEGGCSWDC